MSAPGTATRRRDSGSEPRATYQDVLDAPPHRVAEVVDGVLHTQPRPAMPHALATSSLGHDLTGPFQFGRGGPGGWWIIDEPELHLGEDILVPDLAGWRRERMPDYPDADVLHAGTGLGLRSDLTLDPQARPGPASAPIYARERVGHLWLVEPTDRTLEAFELRNGEWVLLGVREGRRPRPNPPLRGGHLQPRRPVALNCL